jgi:hypothetical protein
LARTTAFWIRKPTMVRRLASPNVMRSQGMPQSIKISSISSSAYTALAIMGIFSSIFRLM